MKSDSGRRWLIAAVGLFLFLLVGWVLLALQLNVALAGPLPFAPRLMSNLQADYSPDAGAAPIGLISLSIMNEALQSLGDALGLTGDEEAALHESMELAMSQPVPTATALNFEGEAPFTATPTVTNTPLPTDTPTPIPTNTPTNTPKPATPTKTASPSMTPEPSGGDSLDPTAAATTVAPAALDIDRPDIVSYEVSPPPGALTVCTITATVRVADAEPSSGISASQVGMKYKPASGSYVYSNNMTMVSPDDPGVPGWDAVYSGSITIDNVQVVGILGGGNTKLARPAFSSGPVALDVWFIVEDNEGHTTYEAIGTYSLMTSCPDI
jgi:hypothetical protein